MKKHVFVFNPQDNGGESLILVTKENDNGDGIPNGIYLTQKLSLQSYSNSASFTLVGTILTPKNLRKLADELEKFQQELLKSK